MVNVQILVRERSNRYVLLDYNNTIYTETLRIVKMDSYINLTRGHNLLLNSNPTI